MSVLIKGMEMPKNCDECYIREKDTCPLTKTNVTGWGIPLNCPLVPVPPHGRLIDADALEADTEWDNREDGYISYSRVAIECAPTIIEAEEGE